MKTRKDIKVSRKGIRIEIPGGRAITVQQVLCDFTGTLSKQGRLLPGVGQRIRKLAKRVRLIVATADTFGTARQALAALPIEVVLVRTGRDKARLLRKLGATHTVAIGNGCNDIPMMQSAILGLGIIGPEGAAMGMLQAADVAFRDVNDALDALLEPRRLTADLRP